jgi:hypothetical protein
MKKNTIGAKKSGRGMKTLIPVVIVLFVFIGIPLLLIQYQASRTGMTWGQVVERVMNRSGSGENIAEVMPDSQKGEQIDFLKPVLIGQSFEEPPLISHVQAVDLDKDGLLDVIVCDSKGNFISWIRQDSLGVFTEKILADELIAPAHVQAFDFDGDGDLDLLVAVMGMLFPNNDKIGSVVVLENDGNFNFTKHVIVDKIARVTDVRGGDLDGDGDNDLAVAQFGYDDGETRWIENLGNWKFKSHILQNLSGPINVEVVDIDKDGDKDLISLVSQEWEEIYCFVNDGKGNFQPKLLYGSSNQDFGSSGIYMADVDQDGDDDILYTNGDAFDYIPPQGRPWHGVQWLENKGDLKFQFHRICNFTGAYNARPTDIDGDGDLDLFVVSAFNLWERPDALSFIWLENTGNMQFVKHSIAHVPTHLLSLELGDFNNDGLMDMVTGAMHAYPPYTHMSRVALWMNNGKMMKKK